MSESIKLYLYFVISFFSLFYIMYYFYQKKQEQNRLRERIFGVLPSTQMRDKSSNELFSGKKNHQTLVQRKIDELLYKKSSIGNPIDLKLYRCGLQKFSHEKALFIFLALVLCCFLIFNYFSSFDLIYIIIGSVLFPILIVTMILAYLEGSRQVKIASQLSPAIEIIARGIRSGASIEKTFHTVVQEAASPLKDEFHDIITGLEFGVAYDKLMHIAAARVNIPEFYFFTTALVIQRESGGSLADVLDNIVNAINKTQELQMKIKSLSSEAQATSYVLAGLPVFILAILYFVRPDHISFLLSDEAGNTLLYMAAILLAAGLLTIKRMIKIEV